MRKLPVLQADEVAKLELRGRLSLKTRPRLNVELGRMDSVSSMLASSSSERARFIKNPTAYLREQSLPVSACHPVAAAPAQTSEVCTVNLVCNANVVANTNVWVAVNVFSLMNVYTRVNLAGTEIAPVALDQLSPSPFRSELI